MQQEIERFTARTDDGRETTLVITQKIIESKLLNGTTEIVRGLKTVRTIDGDSCNRIDDDHFKHVASGTVLTRVR